MRDFRNWLYWLFNNVYPLSGWDYIPLIGRAFKESRFALFSRFHNFQHDALDCKTFKSWEEDAKSGCFTNTGLISFAYSRQSCRHCGTLTKQVVVQSRMLNNYSKKRWRTLCFVFPKTYRTLFVVDSQVFGTFPIQSSWDHLIFSFWFFSWSFVNIISFDCNLIGCVRNLTLY